MTDKEFRDSAAITAMGALLNDRVSYDNVAADAYKIADDMVEERDKREILEIDNEEICQLIKANVITDFNNRMTISDILYALKDATGKDIDWGSAGLIAKALRVYGYPKRTDAGMITYAVKVVANVAI